MTLHSQFTAAMRQRGIMRDVKLRELKERLKHERLFAFCDLSSIMWQCSFEYLDRPIPRTWCEFFRRIIGRLVWAIDLHATIFLLCDVRSKYNSFRKECAATERAAERAEQAYPDHSYFDGDEKLFVLKRMMSTPGGSTVAIKKLIDILTNPEKHSPDLRMLFTCNKSFSAILINNRDEPPIQIGMPVFPSFLSHTAPVSDMWKDKPALDTSEVDNLAPFLSLKAKDFYEGNCKRVHFCKDGDAIMSAVVHNDTSCEILWFAPDREYTVFDIPAICEIVGRPLETSPLHGKAVFDKASAICRMTLIYSILSDFIKREEKYLGITDHAVVALALTDPKIPTFVVLDGDSVSVDKDSLLSYLSVKRTERIPYVKKLEIKSKPDDSGMGVFSQKKVVEETTYGFALSIATRAWETRIEAQQNTHALNRALAFSLYLGLHTNYTWPCDNNAFHHEAPDPPAEEEPKKKTTKKKLPVDKDDLPTEKPKRTYKKKSIVEN